jgi:hypothetical protein
MNVPTIIAHNFRWKLTALLLAMLVWFVIKFAIYKEVTGFRNQRLERQPVMVLKAPDDTRTFRIDPPQVDVVVQASREVSRDDVEAFLNLTTMPDVSSALKQVLVRASGSTKVIRTEPPFVLVEPSGGVPDSITNILKRP